MVSDDAHHLPPLAITMGCPVSIGPEIVLRYHVADRPSRVVVIGDRGVLERCRRELDFAVVISDWRPGEPLVPGAVNVLSPSPLDPTTLEWGRPTAASGRAMAAYVETAIELALSGTVSGMITGPISKTALQAAGYEFPGHTELLAARCGTDRFAMMMAADDLKVVLATIHLPLAAVPGHLSTADIVRLLALTNDSLQRDFAIARPRLAVAGLNPHAGEGGLFGDEEERIIAPAVAAAREAGIEAQGPLPPDTVFLAARNGAFDAVVAMYHDQGLIPFKLLHFVDGVNVTIGLPIVRTSVDHGTAYDIAGQGRADHRSLAVAVRLAGEIAAARAGRRR